MEFTRRTAQLLNEEHRATIAMLEGLETMIARAKRATPDASDPQIQKQLNEVSQTIAQEVRGHFAFEENELFTRLAEMGDVAIGQHLKQEHDAMLPVAERVVEIANSSIADGFTDQAWLEFKALAGELIERMLAHIQKEEMALLPMLEEILEPETDMELAEIYSMNH
jgi:hemerythrin-like domain-containing protein